MICHCNTNCHFWVTSCALRYMIICHSLVSIISSLFLPSHLHLCFPSLLLSSSSPPQSPHSRVLPMQIRRSPLLAVTSFPFKAGNGQNTAMHASPGNFFLSNFYLSSPFNLFLSPRLSGKKWSREAAGKACKVTYWHASDLNETAFDKFLVDGALISASAESPTQESGDRSWKKSWMNWGGKN